MLRDRLGCNILLLYRLAQLEKLKELWLSKNPLKVVPFAIYSITALQKLYLRECELTNEDDIYMTMYVVYTVFMWNGQIKASMCVGYLVFTSKHDRLSYLPVRLNQCAQHI